MHLLDQLRRQEAAGKLWMCRFCNYAEWPNRSDWPERKADHEQHCNMAPRPAEPEPPKADQEPTKKYCLSCKGTGCNPGTYPCGDCNETGFQPKADTGTLEARIEQARADVHKLFPRDFASPLNVLVPTGVLDRLYDVLRDALAEIRRMQQEVAAERANALKWIATAEVHRLDLAAPKASQDTTPLRRLVASWEEVEDSCNVSGESEGAKLHRAFARGVKRCRLELDSTLRETGDKA